MKEIRTEVKTYKTQYEAIDGTIFDDRSECEKYEKTADAVIISAFKKYVKYSKSECQVFDCGSDDYTLEFVEVKDQNAVEAILRAIQFGDNREDILIKNRDILESNIGKIVIVGHDSYDSTYYYLYGTIDSVLGKIKSKMENDIV